MNIFLFLARFLRKVTGRIHYLVSKLNDYLGSQFVAPSTRRAEIYMAERTAFIERQLASPSMMSFFSSVPLSSAPQGYGKGLDERCVEIPWVFANMGAAVRILDAGSALNHPYVLAQPVWKEKKLDILTLTPEGFCDWLRGISYLYSDLRRTPYRDEEFDLVVSVSTLEHVGMDTSEYSGKESGREHAVQDVLGVFRELKRILKPDGRLLFTVPYGRYEDNGSFQQFDEKLLEECAVQFSPAHRADVFFLKSDEGWQAVPGNACPAAAFTMPGSDTFASASAVACCQWWK